MYGYHLREWTIPNFGTGNPVTNTNAVLKSLQGDGSTTTVDVSAQKQETR